MKVWINVCHADIVFRVAIKFYILLLQIGVSDRYGTARKCMGRKISPAEA